MTTDYIEQRAHRAQCIYEDAIRRGETEVDATFLADIECGAKKPPAPRFHPVQCAWCEDDAEPVGQTTVPNSHGICEKHARELVRGK